MFSRETLLFRLKKATKAYFVDKELGKQWSVGEEPRFLFVITPPYSGSTALVQLLNSGPKTALLEERGEGQWLVPSLGNSDRWNPDKKVDWAQVKTVWYKRVAFLRALVQEIDLFIEKSPPHMVRVAELLESFPNHSVLAFNRDPYANCASILFRHYSPEGLVGEKREEVVRKVAKAWVSRSRMVKQAIEQFGILSFTYEEFCGDTQRCLSELVQIEPLLEGVDAQKEVLVKDYAPQKIESQNERQIAKLEAQDIRVISSVLEGEAELMKVFGYEMR